METKQAKTLSVPPVFQGLWRCGEHRYKVYYGGRGGGKSWAIAQMLIIRAYRERVRILCTREFKASISDSVHHLLETQIDEMGLAPFFNVGKAVITSLTTGATFIFKGLRHNPREIKSTEDVDVCWVDEAQSVSKESWQILIPTVRKENSEIIISFNPFDEHDPTDQDFVVNPRPNSIVQKVNWNDNPYFPAVLDMERRHMERTDPDAYQHVWEGNVLRVSDAVIFKGKFEVSGFDPPPNARFYHGADWGFAKDPTALVRCFVIANTLYIDQEAYGVGVDLDATPALFDKISTSRKWPIKADCARPETISFMRRKGFNISAADKWHGSVEDGIAHLRGFDRIVIHERCRHTAEEFRLYSYKVDKNNGDILPVAVDAHNHCVDGNAKIILKRGAVSMKNVRAGEYAATRGGYRKVLWAGKTRLSAGVLGIVTKNGFSVIVTPDHKILTQRGFVRADALVNGDVVYTAAKGGYALCGSAWAWLKRLFTKALFTAVTQTLAAAPIEFTSNPDINSGGKATIISIDRFGKTKMAKFLTAASFIIKMATRSIMTSAILNVSLGWNTLGNILSAKREWKDKKNTLAKFAGSPSNGTLPRKAWRGIQNTGNALTQSEEQKSKPVSIAEKSMSREPSGQMTNSVQMPVNPHGGEKQRLMMNSVYAPFAAINSHAINTAAQKLVPDPVLCVLVGIKPRDVYDLTVDEHHEFIADGIVVHNCVDSVRYALDGLIRKKGQVKASASKPFGY